MARIISKIKLRYQGKNRRKAQIIITSEPPVLEGDIAIVRYYDSYVLETVTKDEKGNDVPGKAPMRIPGSEGEQKVSQAEYKQLLDAAEQMVKAYHPEITEKEKKLEFDAMAQSYALLIFVTHDYVLEDDGTISEYLKYDSKPEDWEIML